MPVHKTDIDRGTKSEEAEFALYCSNCRRVCWFHTPHDSELEGGLDVKDCWECEQETKYRQMDFDVPDDTVMLDEHMSPLSKQEVEAGKANAPANTQEESNDDNTAFTF